MKRSIIVAALFLSLPCAAADQRPDWVDANGVSARYPDSRSVTGYGFAEDRNSGDRTTAAAQNALRDLSSKFIVNIRDEITVKLRETDGNYSSDVRNTISAETRLRLLGVKTVTWDDSRRDRAHALAVMEIDPAIGMYTDYRNNLAARLASLIAAGEAAEKNGDLRQAIVSYRTTFPLFIELGETETVLGILRVKSAFPQEGSPAPPVPLTREGIEARLRNMVGAVTSVKACAVSLAEQLKSQYTSTAPLAVFPLTYRDTDFNSQFSAAFVPVLEAELTQYYRVFSPDNTRRLPSTMVNVLSGAYWVDNGTVRIIVFITNPSTGAKMASGSVEAAQPVFAEAGMELLPPNFDDAYRDTRVFLGQTVIPGSLSLDAWTSKGDRNLIFRQNEETELFVRVNKPCYLQAVYHMANGVRLLLYNNYHIDESRVNFVVALPDTFYFAPPLGVERLQLFASTERFDAPKTVRADYDGETYPNVMAEDFAEHTIAMRGIKKIEPLRELAEKIVTITTVKK